MRLRLASPGPIDYAGSMTPDAFRHSLSAHLFWDVDPESVDPVRHRSFLIPRIMDRGTLADVQTAWAFYGESSVREALLTAASLQRRTIAFFAAQFDLPRDRFRAWRNRASTWDA